MKAFFFILATAIIAMACDRSSKVTDGVEPSRKELPDRFLMVLGVAQDAGYPQIGCTKECCRRYWEGKEEKKHITSLALVDRASGQYWLFEATPDITAQLHELQSSLPAGEDYSPNGIFLTHAHIGHYAGLLQLGKEAMASSAIPVWVMPRMDSFLRNNGPWSQLVSQKNIVLQPLQADSSTKLNGSLRVIPVRVPHRDEFSETVGFIIESDHKRILFMPDIDKWEKWERDITAEIGKVDLALLDGTFYGNNELPGRKMNEIPHPFVEESMAKFSALPDTQKMKIRFIHFNHTNPLLRKESAEKNKLSAAGLGIAVEGMVIGL